MNELDIYKQTFKTLMFTVGAIALCRFTKGYFVPIFVLIGVWCAFSDKLGWALIYFVLMPFFVILSPGLLPKDNSIVGVSLRFGPLLIGLILAMKGASRTGRHRLPFIGMVPFLMVAAISSVDGWVPSVSYMKLVNFSVFLTGLWYGTQNLQHRPKDVFLLRSFFLAMSVLLVFGSIAVIPFPSISYATSLRYALREGGAELANEVFRKMQMEGNQTLFCGITNHSQALSPILACVLVWVLCDMLFLERQFRRQHVLLLIAVLPLLYMTRSRVALISSVFVMGIVSLYTTKKIQLPGVVKQKLNQGMWVGLTLIALVMVVAELKSGAMSGWIRKWDKDDGGTKESLMTSLTSSRMGLMAQSLYEFRRNPLIGSGFQVAEYTRDLVRGSKGLIISASIEKGILPVMVLGETGILGAICFLFFLFTFYGGCIRRDYYVTITTFSVLLITNMGEATFFSPGGIGGLLWMFCTVGGFTIDTTILYRKNLQQQWGQMAAMEYERRMQEAGRRRRLGLD